MNPVGTRPGNARRDALAGASLPGRDSYPLFHRGAHGTFDDLVGQAYALLSIGVDAGSALPPADRAFLDRLGTVLVRIVPPDGDAAAGYCDLDFAYTVFLAGYQRQAALVRPDGTVFGSAVELTRLPGLVAGLRAELAARLTRPAFVSPAASGDDAASSG
jgi:hypothetical protein